MREALGTSAYRESACGVEVKHREALPAWLERAFADVSEFRVASDAIHGAGSESRRSGLAAVVGTPPTLRQE